MDARVDGRNRPRTRPARERSRSRHIGFDKPTWLERPLDAGLAVDQVSVTVVVTDYSNKKRQRERCRVVVREGVFWEGCETERGEARCFAGCRS